MKKSLFLILFFSAFVASSQEKLGKPFFTGTFNFTLGVNENYTINNDEGEYFIEPAAIFLRTGFGYEFKRRVAISFNVGFDYQYTEDDGGGIKCKNYEICEAVLPKWWFECKGSYLCTNCDMMFGTWGSGENSHTGKGILEISDNIGCPICLETKRGISYPKCNHMACIECFKICSLSQKESYN